MDSCRVVGVQVEQAGAEQPPDHELRCSLLGVQFGASPNEQVRLSAVQTKLPAKTYLRREPITVSTCAQKL